MGRFDLPAMLDRVSKRVWLSRIFAPAGLGSERASPVGVRWTQYGDNLVLGDDELATLDEPEGRKLVLNRQPALGYQEE